jgi:hypothetical protein
MLHDPVPQSHVFRRHAVSLLGSHVTTVPGSTWQVCMAGLQINVPLHRSPSSYRAQSAVDVQTQTPEPPAQVPLASQRSPSVQGSPSSQAAPTLTACPQIRPVPPALHASSVQGLLSSQSATA